jgi:hypothetical protein
MHRILEAHLVRFISKISSKIGLIYVEISPPLPLRIRLSGNKDANAGSVGEHMKGLKESRVSNFKPETYTK